MSAPVVSGNSGTFTNLNGTLGTAVQNSITSATSLAAVSTITTGTWESTINSNLEDTNVAMGDSAGAAATSGTENCVFIGHQAGDQVTGDRNTIIGGENTAPALTTGSSNTIVGARAGRGLLTSNGFNTCIGEAACYQGAEGGTPSTYSTYLGYNATSSGGSGVVSNEIMIGASGTGKGSDTFTFGKTGSLVYNDFSTDASWSYDSDVRIKKEISTINIGLDFINDLNPVNFKYKQKEDLDEFTEQEVKNALLDEDGESGKNTNVQYGFIAQEVKETMDNHGVSDFYAWKDGGTSGIQGVSVGSFVTPLIKAIQELSSKIESLESRLAALE